MPASSTFFAVPYAIATDAVQTVLAVVIKSLADRIDYLLGETGDDSITPSAANTKTTKAIAFAREYKTPPRVVLSPGKDNSISNFASTVTLTMWVDDVSATGFTVAINASNTSGRDFTWHARPKRTDVTP